MNHSDIEAERLRVYTTETARHEGRPLFEWLIAQALGAGLAGATATKGLAGFGHHRKLHHAHLLDISDELPVIVEIIDTPQRIDALLTAAAEALGDHTYTREPVRLHRHPDPGDQAGKVK